MWKKQIEKLFRMKMARDRAAAAALKETLIMSGDNY